MPPATRIYLTEMKQRLEEVTRMDEVWQQDHDDIECKSPETLIHTFGLTRLPPRP
jgi:hypothetical protein